MDQLHREVDRLTRACQPSGEITRDHNFATEAELKEKMLKVDLRDGIICGAP